MGWQDTRTKPRRFEERDPKPDVPGLEVVAGQSAGRFIALEPGSWLIGRAEDCAVQLADDGVSRHHARLRVGPDGSVRVADLSSLNGTYLNGAAVRTANLQAGDRLQVGNTCVLRLTYRIPTAVAAEPAEPVAPMVALSPRELQVACLVAEGLTNSQIATRLGIRTKTVAAHIANVFQRIGISRRTQLVRYVLEHGLRDRSGGTDAE